MNNSSVATTTDSDAYFGIPVYQDKHFESSISASSSSTTVEKVDVFDNLNSEPWNGKDGLIAFTIGFAIAIISSVAVEGWTIIGSLLFGTFEYSTWKHFIFLFAGYIITLISACALFVLCFLSSVGDEEEKGVRDDRCWAVQGLVQGGFMIGYFIWRSIIADIVYKPFGVSLGPVDGFDVSLVLGCLVFMKVIDYCRLLPGVNSINGLDDQDVDASSNV